MLSRLNKLKNKKGFTLVELIVVLVILAILLAILVPSLTKWIDKAKEKQALVSARTVYLACQTIASEDYAKVTPAYCDKLAGTTVSVTTANAATLAGATATADETFGDEVAKLANLNAAYTLKCKVDANGVVTTFECVISGKTVTMADGALKVA